MEHKANPKSIIKKDELDSMKKWLQSLSEEQLIEAMSFPFETNSSGKCHEYDLLVQMLYLQSTPPVPIHPRAMGVKLASSKFANDGRNEIQRVMKNRRERPRLFQFIEREHNDSSIDSSFASLPPEIAAIVRKESKTNSGGIRKGAAKRERHFEVIARQFVTKWGDVLSVGPTNEMKDADELILMLTCIQSGCRLVGGNGKDQRKIWCTFCDRERPRSENNVPSIRRILHVVSRGRAFTCAPNNDKGTYFASWFDPTKEFFSLSSYLASRLEVALWTSFREAKKKSSSTSIIRPRWTLLEETFSRLPTNEFEKCFQSSVALAFRKCFLEASTKVKTRDLLLHEYFSTTKSMFGNNVNKCPLKCIPIVQLKSVTNQFRIAVIECCEAYASKLVENDLIKSSKMGTCSSQNKFDARNKSKGKKRRKKRKKKVTNGLGAIDEKRVENSIEVDCEQNTNAAMKEKNTISISFDGKCLVTHSKEVDQNYQEFLETTQKPKKKVKNGEMKYILKKSKKPATSSQMRPISKPKSIDDVNISPARTQNDFYEYQLTMKRNNLTNSHSIWNVPEDTYDLTNFQSMKPESTGTQSTKYQKISGIFIPPASNGLRKPNHAFDASSNIGLPMNSDDDFLYGMKPYEGLFSDFFNDSTGNHDANFASSTAASIASSVLDNDDDSSLHVSSDERKQEYLDFAPPVLQETVTHAVVEEDDESSQDDNNTDPERLSPNSKSNSYQINISSTKTDSPPIIPIRSHDGLEVDSETSIEAPHTPPAQLSPILLSLADLGEMRRRATFQNIGDILEKSSAPNDSQPQSLASLPVPKRSFSREDLRISHTKDDGHLRRKIPLCSSRTVDFSSLSYRNAALKNTMRARSVSSHDFAERVKQLRPQLRRAPSMKSFPREIKTVIIDGSINLDVCAQSESALDDHEDSSHWNVIPKIGFDENDNATTAKDGATTISSIPAPQDIDELIFLREERDSYRDMCLTMAAEISKLKNILALERINTNYSTPQTTSPFESEYMPSFYHNRQQGSIHRYVAMSDAGLNDIPMSEDGTDVMQASVTTADKGRRRISRTSSVNNRIQSTSIGKTGGSDMTSLEHDNATYSVAPTIPPNRKYSGPNNLNQSRLSREIDYFLASVATKLENQARRRSVAIERLTALVNTIWPRAQVLLYGSHQTDLHLPTSDLDFVICLPNVHKKEPADAPGALEGRNAINESNQKLIARKLKSESWIGKIFALP